MAASTRQILPVWSADQRFVNQSPGNKGRASGGGQMAEKAASDDAEDEGDKPAAKPKSKLKLLMIAVPVLLALAGGGYFGAAKFGLLGHRDDAHAEAAKAEPQQLYYDLPEMIVNLSATDKRAQFLKLKVALEAEDPATLERLKPVQPRLLDMFQTYLRELRSTDLEGSAGLFRLKEELMRRVNLEIQPSKINRVLFKEIIVQ